MQFKWNNKNTTHFLRLYRKHRCLWNQYDAEYLNCNVKNKAFIDIIEELNMPGLSIADCILQLKLISEKWKCEHRYSIQCTRKGIIYKSEIPWYPLVTEMWEEAIHEEEKSRSSLIAEKGPSREQHKDHFRAVARSDTAVVQKRKKKGDRQIRFKHRTSPDINSQKQFVPCTTAVFRDKQIYNERKRLQKKSESSPVMSDITPCNNISIACTKERTVPRNNNDNNIITNDCNIRNTNDRIKSPIQYSVCPSCPWKKLNRELPNGSTVPCPNYSQPHQDNVNKFLYNPNENDISNDLNEAIIPCTNVSQEVERIDDLIDPYSSPVYTHCNGNCYNELDTPDAKEMEINIPKKNCNEKPVMVKCTATDIIEDEDRECDWYLQCTIVMPEINPTQDLNGKGINNCSCEVQAVNDVKQQGTSPNNTSACIKEMQTVNDVKQQGVLTNDVILCTKEGQYCQNNNMQNELLNEKEISANEDKLEHLSKSVECFLLPHEKENKLDQIYTINTDRDKLKISEISQESSTTLKNQPELNKSTLKLDNQAQQTDIQNVSKLEGDLAEKSNEYSDLVQEGTSVFDMDKNIGQKLLFTIEEEGICEACKPASEKKFDLDSWFRRRSALELFNDDCLPCRLESELNFQLSRLTKTFIDVMDCTTRLAVKEEFDKKVSCECSSERRTVTALTNRQYTDQEVNAVENDQRTADKIESDIQAVPEHQNKAISVTPTRKRVKTSSISALPSSRHIGIQETAKIKLRNVNIQKTGKMDKISISEPINIKSHKKKIAIQKRDLNLKDVGQEEEQEQRVLKSSENIPKVNCETYTNTERNLQQPLSNNIYKNNWKTSEISIREKSRIFKKCCNEELWEDFSCDENCKDKRQNGDDCTKLSSIICDDCPHTSMCDTSLCTILKNVFTHM